MIDPHEHVYDDDPGRGHADVRTRLKDAAYFFLGNGQVQAAVQWAPAGEGTPLGLLLMDPDRLRKKREALTQHPEHGLHATMVQVSGGAAWWSPQPGNLRVAWDEEDGVPAVVAEWDCPAGRIRETFCCPNPALPLVARTVRRSADGPGPRLRLRTGIGERVAEAPLAAAADAAATFLYELDVSSGSVAIRAGRATVSREARARWSSRSRLEFGHAGLDRLVRASQFQLDAALSARGRMDSSIWQYNREWVRDQSLVAIGFLMSGDPERAGCVLSRLLSEFVTPDGGAMDSSEARAADEAELDQNGVLLYAINQFVRWTGDASMLEAWWPRIAAAADYPLRPEFAHPGSGLLFNAREFWERHRVHGIGPGLELAHQVYVSLGLDAAASLARRAGRDTEAERWNAASARLKTAALSHPTHALIEGGRLIKRRNLDGSWCDSVEPRPGSLMPPGVPLLRSGPHRLDPDTCLALPIVHRFVAPHSELACATLESLEPLWSQGWTGGGYGRYDVTSEPDSPGGWPFASLFVARASVEAGKPDRAWRVIDWLGRVAGAPAGSWFEFYGERISPPFPQVGIVPWTWSELLALAVEQVLGLRQETGGMRIAPRLLPGLDHASALIHVSGGEFCLRVERERRSRPLARLNIDGRPIRETTEGEAIIARAALRGAAVDLEILLPSD